MRRKEYVGEEITITFDMKRCIHARNCFLKLPDVFDPSQRPWVQPDKASADDIAAMIRTCPSGALAFRRNGAQETPPGVNRVSVLENGPLALAGDITVDGAAAETRVTLCRCGLSKNKPYCDYSHVDGAFEATGEPKANNSAQPEGRGGPVSVTATPNGPLKVDGHVEITTGTGSQIATVSKAFLCRCGASKNKPFCDGSHTEAGFSSD